MIGKIIGGLAGAQASKHFRNIGGTGGAILGAAVVPVISRMRLPALIALGAGGYAVKKLLDRKKAQDATVPPEAEAVSA